MEKAGSILGVPYDFRRPTMARFRERFFNPDDQRVLTPHFFGIGWSINFAALKERSTLGFIIAATLTCIALLNIIRSSMRSFSRIRRRIRELRA
jgi:hypothetical protein